MDPHTETERDDPLVNLYLEEAASVAVSDLLSTLLSQARSFDCAVTLATQFPGQFAQHEAGTYEEVLNNVSTIITGNVPLDRDLAERLATEDLNSRAVRARLRALKRGQWFVSLPAGFGKPAPRPFLVESAPLPAGHPESTRPLTPAEETRFQHLLQACAVETGDRAGIHLTTPGELIGMVPKKMMMPSIPRTSRGSTRHSRIRTGCRRRSSTTPHCMPSAASRVRIDTTRISAGCNGRSAVVTAWTLSRKTISPSAT
ncbi:hypothetical protein ACFQFH_14915 [Halobaculum halobium]|uniref:hypothetical protein n=1 Tax=Halobaculum halobium TaxID=3032281 RepID=UPI0036207DE3